VPKCCQRFVTVYSMYSHPPHCKPFQPSTVLGNNVSVFSFPVFHEWYH
jgi:hypothetical protein